MTTTDLTQTLSSLSASPDALEAAVQIEMLATYLKEAVEAEDLAEAADIREELEDYRRAIAAEENAEIMTATDAYIAAHDRPATAEENPMTTYLTTQIEALNPSAEVLKAAAHIEAAAPNFLEALATKHGTAVDMIRESIRTTYNSLPAEAQAAADDFMDTLEADARRLVDAWADGDDLSGILEEVLAGYRPESTDDPVDTVAVDPAYIADLIEGYLDDYCEEDWSHDGSGMDDIEPRIEGTRVTVDFYEGRFFWAEPVEEGVRYGTEDGELHVSSDMDDLASDFYDAVADAWEDRPEDGIFQHAPLTETITDEEGVDVAEVTWIPKRYVDQNGREAYWPEECPARVGYDWTVTDNWDTVVERLDNDRVIYDTPEQVNTCYGQRILCAYHVDSLDDLEAGDYHIELL